MDVKIKIGSPEKALSGEPVATHQRCQQIMCLTVLLCISHENGWGQQTHFSKGIIQKTFLMQWVIAV